MTISTACMIVGRMLVNQAEWRHFFKSVRFVRNLFLNEAMELLFTALTAGDP